MKRIEILCKETGLSESFIKERQKSGYNLHLSADTILEVMKIAMSEAFHAGRSHTSIYANFDDYIIKLEGDKDEKD